MENGVTVSGSVRSRTFAYQEPENGHGKTEAPAFENLLKSPEKRFDNRTAKC
jgi:hypothetical protein